VRIVSEKHPQPVRSAKLPPAAQSVVMGGYGHSGCETIFGGVTTHIKWHATLPVLMSH
jgi:nucleotide-binding universal stress UspA family protein